LTSAGSAEEKLRRAFRVYDVDGNGELDVKEMSKVIQVSQIKEIRNGVILVNVICT